MDKVKKIVDVFTTVFKVLVAFLNMLGVTEDTDKEALNNLFDDVDALVENAE